MAIFSGQNVFTLLCISRSCHSSTDTQPRRSSEMPESRGSSCQSQGPKAGNVFRREGGSLGTTRWTRPRPAFFIVPGLKCKVQQLGLLHSTSLHSTLRSSSEVSPARKAKKKERGRHSGFETLTKQEFKALKFSLLKSRIYPLKRNLSRHSFLSLLNHCPPWEAKVNLESAVWLCFMRF